MVTCTRLLFRVQFQTSPQYRINVRGTFRSARGCTLEADLNKIASIAVGYHLDKVNQKTATNAKERLSELHGWILYNYSLFYLRIIMRVLSGSALILVIQPMATLVLPFNFNDLNKVTIYYFFFILFLFLFD